MPLPDTDRINTTGENSCALHYSVLDQVLMRAIGNSKEQTVLDRKKFYRRRQFVLGSEFVDYEGWHRIRLFGDYKLTSHPDLPITIVEGHENMAILLGYIIDPHQPELSDESILRRFVAGRVTVDTIVEGLYTLSGRFVLAISCPQGSWVFPDACALRQLNYCLDEHGSVWCASQAETLAEHFGFEYDEEVLSYRESPAYSSSKEEFWLINDRTPYREIKYLLANHYLDLFQGKTFRFWPTAGCIGSLTMDKSIRLVAPLLQNSIKAAALRFDLKMGITAGSDSRRSLAAAKDVKEKIYFFTHTPNESHAIDMEIPPLLLAPLGIEHHKVSIGPMEDEFSGYYQSSATWARQRRGAIAWAALNHFGSEGTVLVSDRSEIHECWNWLPKSRINGEGLAVATMLKHPFATSEFQKWIDGAQAACVASNMNILVLYDLEPRSRWVAAAHSEYDIAYETFCPYNNRYLFCLELSVSERYRRSRQLTFLINQIRYMWAEVLAQPINPEQRMLDRIKKFLLNCIVHKTITPFFPIYDFLRYLKLKQEFRRQDEI